MLIFLEEGDVVKMPTGCLAKVESNNISIVNPERIYEDGTIFFDSLEGNISIYKCFDGNVMHVFHVSLYPNGQLIFEDYDLFFKKSETRIATAEECKRLFAALKEKGFRWNAEILAVEKTRWRAATGKFYFHIDARLGYDIAIEVGNDEDDERYNKWNYFETAEKAAAAVKVVEAALKKFHEENK